jgi:hypothetical protein
LAGETVNVPDCYWAWAPAESPWSAWVKPVLFAGDLPPASTESLALADVAPRVRGVRAGASDTFVIVDEPGATSVAIGVALAAHGFRPVPLFNGVDGEPALVAVDPIVRALVAGAERVAAATLEPGAPPAFLLDSNRLNGHPAPRVFDNRWVVVPEDFPSANRLLAAGHRRCVLIGSSNLFDLPHVLLRYQRAGIALFALSATGQLVSQQVKRPSFFGAVFARARVMVGLRRSSGGGFGAAIPAPPEGGHGYG